MGAHHHQDVIVDYAGRTDGQPVYVGYADPGSDGFQSIAIWSIFKCLYDGSGNFIEKVWAMLPTETKGNNLYNKVWADRTTYTYN